MLFAKIGTARKTVNSTAVPSLFNKYETNIVLKDGTSIERPTFILSRFTENPDRFNYMSVKYGEDTLYYWIIDKVYNSGTWEFSCKKDNLATYREEIGDSVQHIARCADERFIDTNIVDSTAIPTYLEYQNQINYFMPTFSFDDPTYVVRFQGLRFSKEAGTLDQADINTYGAVTLATNKENFSKLIVGVQACVSAPNVTCSWTLSDFIKDVYVLPWTLNTFKSMTVGGTDTAHFFSYIRIDNSLTQWTSTVFDNVGLPLQISGFLIPQGAVWKEEGNLNARKHKQLTEKRNWLESDAGTHVYMTWAPIGKVELPSELLRKPRKLQLCYDFTSNAGTFSIVDADTGANFWSTHIPRLGVHYMTVSSDRNMEGLRILKGIASAVMPIAEAGTSAATSFADGNIAAGAVTAVTGGVRAGLAYMQGSKVTTETLGGVTDWSSMKTFPNPCITTCSQMFSFAPGEKVGYPSNKDVQIRRLEGVIFCDNVILNIPGIMPDEVAEITAYMKGGFYFE